MSEDLKRPPEADDLTRRQWILRLGEFVALAGVSGLVPEVAASIAGRQVEQSNANELPPGLYDASQEHLVHALSSAGGKWTPPLGSETEYASALSIDYQPKFFVPDDFKIVTRVIEILLGNVEPTASSQAARWLDLWLSEVPGVRAAAQQLDPLHRTLAVAFYGENRVRDVESAHPEAIARVGIRGLRDLSTRLYGGRDFLQLTADEQAELLITTTKAEPGTSMRKFYELTRAEAIRGYYTSAEGLNDLDYRGNAYYGDCPGCERKT